MRFKLGSDMLQVNFFNVVDENNAMRIAHADARHFISHAVNFDRLADQFLTAKAIDGNFIGVENRFAHVDGN